MRIPQITGIQNPDKAMIFDYKSKQPFRIHQHWRTSRSASGRDCVSPFQYLWYGSVGLVPSFGQLLWRQRPMQLGHMTYAYRLWFSITPKWVHVHLSADYCFSCLDEHQEGYGVMVVDAIQPFVFVFCINSCATAWFLRGMPATTCAVKSWQKLIWPS